MGEHKRFGLKVVEADDEAVMKTLQVDIDQAEEVRASDPNNKSNLLSCVLAQAATRTYGAEQVAILRRHAYIAYPGEGVTRRYLLDERSYEILAAFDRGDQIIPGIEVRFKKPTKSTTRAAHRKSNKKFMARMKGVARPITERKQRKTKPLERVVRNGNLVSWK